MLYDHPAARLLAVLEAGRAKSPGSNCREVWEELLAVKNDDPLLMARLGKLMELPHLAVQSLHDMSPDLATASVHWASKVNGAFMSQDVGGKWETFIGRIDDHTVRYLRFAADVLQARSNTALMASEKLLNVRAELDAILTDILASNEPADLKQFLTRSLRNIIAAIDEYHLTGAVAFMDSVEATIGHAAIDSRYQTFLVKTELGHRLSSLLENMANIITVAQGLPELTGVAIALLSKAAQ